MSTPNHETEAKFAVRDEAVLEALEHPETLGPFSAGEPRVVEQTDQYHDTPERAAAAGGVSIRVRQVGETRKYTVKTGKVAGALTRRTEIEEPADARSLADWLVSLINDGRLALDVAPQDLSPALTIRTRRVLRDLTHPSGARVELALDRVIFSGPRGERADLELEAELTEGEDAALQELSDWLQANHDLQPASGSKYERGLAAVG